MPLLPYRTKQSTNTTGTGTLVLNAAETNARSFNVAFGASSRRILYMIQFATGFEFGLGDFDGGSPGNLTRATVLASSNANALVTLAGGTKDVFAVLDPAAREVISISGTSTLGLADLGNAVVFTGASASTLNLPAVATAPLGAGWTVINSGTAALTIDPNGAEQVNGATTLVLQAGGSAIVLRVSGAWQAAVISNNPIGATGAALMAAATPSAGADVLSAAPVDIASAATTDIGAATSPNVRITGTTTITGFGTAPSGTTRKLRFVAALTLTHNATSLILPGAANIITAAGDTAEAISLGSGNWVLVNFQPATQAGMRLLSNTPALPNTTGGVAGTFVFIGAGGGSATVLPAGGTWVAFGARYDSAGAFDGNVMGTVAAGGTLVGAALAGRTWIAWGWRIS